MSCCGHPGVFPRHEPAVDEEGVAGDEVGRQVPAERVQYGVVWPDGSLTWEQIPRSAGNTPIMIASLVEGADLTDLSESSAKWGPKYFDDLLQARAGAALLDVDEYRDQHRFVKRTVILSVTATEEV